MPDGRIGRVMRPSGPMPSLAQQASTGAGTAFGLGGGFTTFGVFLNRNSTGTAGGSTKASVRFQTSVDGVHFITVGAATMAVNTTAGAFFTRASTQGPMAYARLSINTFTTATNANPDKVAINGFITCQGV